ncbi:hypothetical protein GCM10020001_008050 [Nonomuraea salmonea]
MQAAGEPAAGCGAAYRHRDDLRHAGARGEVDDGAVSVGETGPDRAVEEEPVAGGQQRTDRLGTLEVGRPVRDPEVAGGPADGGHDVQALQARGEGTADGPGGTGHHDHEHTSISGKSYSG